MTGLDVLKARGFIGQMTHEAEITELLEKEKVTFYIGFDPTADSLTAGHFMTIMAMSHMQRAGHRPIVLIGGGTTMVGDPTDKTDMRKMLTKEQIDANAEIFKTQLSKFIDFSDDKAIMINNDEWLLNLNYVEFLREIGAHFSVNRMLTADCYKTRMEKGLTFLEFNYMIMQSYDFLVLNEKFGCNLQMGGNDQWSNILGGVDLIRRKRQQPAFGVTFNLLTTSEGKKMGKTEKGAVWLDPEKTSPFEFFQYFRNVSDADVIKTMKLLTYLPLEEISVMESWEGAELNKAKEILAFEVTKIVHGQEAALAALDAAKALFAGAKDSDNIPSSDVERSAVLNGYSIADAFVGAGLVGSKSEVRRLVQQNGLSLNEKKVTDFTYVLTEADFVEGKALLQKGKKIFHQLIIK
ncbi:MULTISPECIES: tyrosine--tRNA ligase [unclassified Fusibacter]|uniref:tyrosine--tRNA ligase n=1 Tax=unclassified Fusibacter TaxID=2624464 RepID=UPI001011B14F|nr:MULTISPECIES: tyrosine--tRNA ligase [unclassified Fusibacter]MCK8059080.1 tyrosine--tRNA ligase [Fusibacter sp. A2]NPE22489.1 tyrosine--tRNA ligase [Fusibacter sp. A1]RXV60593.1 tyrosine--tRNA ligase [Fusibacter sp. A1]